MSTAPQKYYTSDFLRQFKATGCTYSQDIVDGLKQEIAELKGTIAALREEIGELGAECQEAEKQRLEDQQRPCANCSYSRQRRWMND